MRNFLLPLFFLFCAVVSLSAQECGIIAHRGFWDSKGATQNGASAFATAQKAGFYGSEFDVVMTKDGVPVVNHDNDINGIKIEKVDYKDIASLQLDNGEMLPTLEQFLRLDVGGETIYIIEIKPLSNNKIEVVCVDKVLELVEQYDMAARVEYISFSKNVCDRLVEKSEGARVSYLGGDMKPETVKKRGYTGIDYHYSVYQRNPKWVSRAKELSLDVNVWTVNTLELMDEMLKMGVDFITTDNPMMLRGLLYRY